MAEKDNDVTKVYNITNLHAVKMRLECSHHQQKPIFEKYRSYGRADYQKLNDIMSTRLFSPVCYTNIDMYSELCQNTEKLNTGVCSAENETSTRNAPLDNSKYIESHKQTENSEEKAS